MIGISQLAKSFGGRTLFEGVSLQLNPGSRYGLVGANGSGKTTFLKIVAGDEQASDGQVNIPAQSRMGVLRQDLSLDDDQIIMDLAMMGDAEVWKLTQERARMLEANEADGLADLELSLKNAGGYTLEARAGSILTGLGIPASSHRMPLSSLSGGFKLRVLLAQVLLGGPDILL
ncbi:MAG: ABC-F family ATP-binding cassette domain-containing protein, partial [Proteobacteria bacterium]